MSKPRERVITTEHAAHIVPDATVPRTEAPHDQAMFQTLVTFTADAVIGASLDGTIVSWSPAAERLLGWRAAEMIGRQLSTIAPPERADEQLGLIRRVQSGETVVNFITERLRKDGTRVVVAVSAAPTRDADGTPTGMVGTLRDVTQQHRAELEAAKRTEQLHEAQAMAKLGSWEWDLATNRLDWSNEMHRLFGTTPGAGAPDFEGFLHMVHPDDVDAVQTASLATLRGAQTLEVEYRIFLPGGELRTMQSRGRVIIGAHGRPVRVAGTTQDISEQREAERALRAAEEAAGRLEEQRRRARMEREYAARLRLLNESFLAINAVTRVRATLRRTAEQGAQLLGAERVVAALDAASVNEPGSSHEGTAAVAVSAGSSVAPTGSSILLSEGDRLTAAVRAILDGTREPLLLSLDEAPRRIRDAGGDPLLAGALRGLVAASLVGPAGEPTGVLWATSKEDGGEFNETDLASFVQLAQIASIATEKARRFERERAVASTLQRSFLPERLPEPEGATLHARYVAGGAGLQVGGDWYDAIALRPGLIAVVIGDVEGHGVRAAASMGQLRNALRAYAWEGFGPDEALSRVNDMMERLGEGLFSTALYALLDIASAEVRFASAGHLPPLIVPASGEPRFLDVTPGPPVGALPGRRYAESRLRLRRGDSMIFYTDGLVESRARPLTEGMDRMRSLVRPGQSVQMIVDRLVEKLPAPDQRDDIAIIGVELHPVAVGLRLRLPSAPVSLATLREELRSYLRSIGMNEEEAYDVTLACSEAAANAIEHPVSARAAEFEVEAARRGDEVVVRVQDFGSWRDSPSLPGRGRGLRIMRAVSDVDVERREDGTVVRLRRRVRLPV